ncbi:MAG: DNA polymerase IV [Mariprofundaceae bacterium]|nr:DNA polymerase IV [Mariprofundaceae bacterium]
MRQRKIIHVDMDAFFASVEQRDHPEYYGKPLIVGGKPNSRGVVAACSYEARKFGIHSAMPCSQAYRLCPEAIFVPTRFEAYREASAIIRDIFWRYASQVEPLSLDEAYLDVSYTESFAGIATEIAKAIKIAIKKETELTASAGISYNKFLAKVASDMDKPDGLYVITPKQGAAFVQALPIEKFYGVGPATAKKMKALNIHQGNDLKAWSLADLQTHFGKSANYYYNIARGIDERPIRSFSMRQSLGKEVTFTQDILDIGILLRHFESLTEQVFKKLNEHKLQGKNITIKIKYSTFKQVTRSHTQSSPIGKNEALKCIPKLLQTTNAGKQTVRLVGLTVRGFGQEKEPQNNVQLDLKF